MVMEGEGEERTSTPKGSGERRGAAGAPAAGFYTTTGTSTSRTPLLLGCLFDSVCQSELTVKSSPPEEAETSNYSRSTREGPSSMRTSRTGQTAATAADAAASADVDDDARRGEEGGGTGGDGNNNDNSNDDTTPSPTSLYSKLDELELKWSSTRERDQQRAGAGYGCGSALFGADDDGSSLLSMGSTSLSFQQRNSGPLSSNNSAAAAAAVAARSSDAELINNNDDNVVSSTPSRLLDDDDDNYDVRGVRPGRGRGIGGGSSGPVVGSRSVGRFRGRDAGGEGSGGGGGSSVFDRLYNDAKAKTQRQERRREGQQQQRTRRSGGGSRSVVSSPAAPRGAGGRHPSSSSVASSSILTTPTREGEEDSVFDRLYRNQRRRSPHHQHAAALSPSPRMSSAGRGSEDANHRSRYAERHAQAAAALERRLSYRPTPVSGSGRMTPPRTIRTTRTTTVDEEDDESIMSSWSERLYRNLPRPKREEAAVTTPAPRQQRPRQQQQPRRTPATAGIGASSRKSRGEPSSPHKLQGSATNSKTAATCQNSIGVRTVADANNGADGGDTPELRIRQKSEGSPGRDLTTVAMMPETDYGAQQLTTGIEVIAGRSGDVIVDHEHTSDRPPSPVSRELQAMTIQAYWRSFVAQKEYLTARACAMIIQSVARGYLCRCAFLSKQQLLYLSRLHEREHAAVQIQCWWRSALLRLDFLFKRYCIVSIQSAARGHLRRRDFRSRKQAALAARTGDAAARLQAWWRGSELRIQLPDFRCRDTPLHNLALAQLQGTDLAMVGGAANTEVSIIQSWWRMRLTLVAFRLIRASTITIQRAYRHSLRRRRRVVSLPNVSFPDVEEYSAIMIQAFWRGAVARDGYLLFRYSSVRIQSVWRGFSCRKHFRLCRTVSSMSPTVVESTAVRIQAWWRASIAHDRLLFYRFCATTIASAWRSYNYRMRVRRQLLVGPLYNFGATVFQNTWRMHLARSEYVYKRSSAIMIQTSVRGKLRRTELIKLRSATISVQCWYRTCRRLRGAAATSIQAFYRGSLARSFYLRALNSAILIESLIRCKKARKVVDIKRNAALRVQALVRLFLEKKYRRRAAAIIIQKWFRGRALLREYRVLRDAAILIQGHTRGARARSDYRCKKATSTEAAVLIQKIWRSSCARTNYNRQRQSAILVQSIVRRLHARNDFKLKLTAALKLQTHFRCSLCRWKFHEERRKIILLQSLIRRVAVERNGKRRDVAAATVQRIWRGNYARMICLKRQKASVLIQKVASRKLQQMEYVRVRLASVTVQRYCRQYLARCTLQELQRRKDVADAAAATTIQSLFRMTTARMELFWHIEAIKLIQAVVRGKLWRVQYSQILFATITLQRFGRGHQVRSKFDALHHEREEAGTKIQRTWRAASGRIKFLQSRASVVLIQKIVRGKQQRVSFSLAYPAVQTIQRRWRAHLAHRAVEMLHRKREERRKITELAATKIQCTWRGALCRSNIRNYLAAAALIQKLFRGMVLRRKYADARLATVTVQRCCRRYLARRYLKTHRRERAAIVIQKTYRGELQRFEYAYLRFSIITLQRHCRGYLTLRVLKAAQRKRAATMIQKMYRGGRLRIYYRSIRRSSITIQRYYRRHLAQLQLNQLQEARTAELACVAAIKIQNSYRGKLQRIEYRSLRLATITIQRHCRYYLSKHQLKVLLAEEEAATKIQTVYRSKIQRVEYVSRRLAIFSLQQFCRSYLARQRLRRMLQQNERIAEEAATKIQKICRGKLQRTKIRSHCMAAVCLQLFWRGYLERSKSMVVLEERKFAATKIQRTYRGKLQRIKYRSLCLAAEGLQRGWRGYRARCDFIEERNCAAIVIQRVYRGKLQQVRCKSTWRAIVTIQRYSRIHLACTTAERQRNAACAIQSFVRMTLARRKKLSDDVRNAAATTIQKLLRGNDLRLGYIYIRYSIIVIQSFVRCAIARSKYRCAKSTRDAAVLIQRIWRRYHRQLHYFHRRLSIVLIQAFIRSSLVRKDFSQQHLAASKIQAGVRAVKCKQHFATSIGSAIILQSFFRYLLRRKAATRVEAFGRMVLHKRKYCSLRGASITIQTAYRASHYRRRLLTLRKDKTLPDASATTIQATTRMMLSRLKFIKAQGAAQVIQASWRGSLQRLRFCAACQAIVVLQNTYRSSVARRALSKLRHQRLLHNVHATVLQSAWRMSLAKQKFMQARGAVVLLQSVIRESLQRMNYLAIRHAAVKMQTTFRSYIARHCLLKLREEQVELRELLLRTSSAVRIQASARGMFARDHYRITKAATSMIQAVIRGRQARLRFGILRSSSIMLQSLFRGFDARRKFQEAVSLISSATCIQRHWRGVQARNRYRTCVLSILLIQAMGRRRRARAEYVACRSSAMKIQASFRGHSFRRQLLEASAICIQRCWRGWTEQKHFQSCVALISLIQATIRGRQSRLRYATLRSSSVQVQSCYRKYAARRLYLQAKKDMSARVTACVLIQTAARMCMARHRFVECRSSAAMIQATIRRVQTQRQFKFVREALVAIQSSYRKHHAQSDFNLSVASAVMIQTAIRGRLDRMKYLSISSSVVSLQRQSRIYLARQRLKELSRQMALQRLAQEQENLISKGVEIQRVWRGSVARSLYATALKSIVVIQSCTRRHIHRVKYLKVSAASIVIQSRFRRMLVMHEMRELRRQIDAITKIQAICRRFIFLIRYLRMPDAASKIQRWYYRRKAKILLLKLKTYVVLLQRSVMGNLPRRTSHFALLMINSALRSPALGAFFRFAGLSDEKKAYIASEWKRTESRARKYSSILLQCFYRGHLCRMWVFEMFGFEAVQLLQHRRLEVSFSASSIVPDAAIITHDELPHSPEHLILQQQQQHAPHTSRAPVAVKVVEKISDHSVRIELCQVTYFQRNHAARILQIFAKKILQDLQEKRRVRRKRESERIVMRANEAAKELTLRLFEGRRDQELTAMKAGLGTCVLRLAQQAREARLRIQQLSLERMGVIDDNMTGNTRTIGQAEEKRADDENQKSSMENENLSTNGEDNPIVGDGWEWED